MIACLGEHHGADFGVFHGDCVSIFAQLPEASVDF